MTIRDEKLKGLILKLAGEYFARESNHQSLITITNVEILRRGSMARLLITVLPEEQEGVAILFMKRHLTEFRRHVMEHAKLMRIPYFEVAIDKGEKNRQLLDDIGKTR